MSISSPRAVNPVEKWLEFRSDEKTFGDDKPRLFYYDKEEKKNVAIKLPAYFVILDELHSMAAGYSEDKNCGFQSTEVKTLNEPLHVRTFRGNFSVEGTYNEIKDAAKAEGAKYTRSIYAVWNKTKDEKEIVNIRLSGAAYGVWFNFKFDQQKHVVIFTDKFETGKKGKVEYYMPVFDKTDMTQNALDHAIELDRDVLQPYFASKSAKINGSIEGSAGQASTASVGTNVVPEPIKPHVAPMPEPEDDLPF